MGTSLSTSRHVRNNTDNNNDQKTGRVLFKKKRHCGVFLSAIRYNQSLNKKELAVLLCNNQNDQEDMVEC